MKNKVKIVGVKFDPLTYADLYKWISTSLKGDSKNQIVKANGEFLHRALTNKKFFDLMNSASLCIADGVGILWADKYLSLKLPTTNYQLLKKMAAFWQLLYSGVALIFNPKWIKNDLPERLSGVEVFYTMMKACAESNEPVFYLGARPEIIEKAVGVIKERVPNLKVAGYKDGYGDKGKEIIEMINKTDATLLIVALGSPEQDYWIQENLPKLKNIKVAVGEGGSFDSIAGAAKRAPKLIQSINLEWLWRMFTIKNLTNNAPHRFKRAWNAVLGFMFEAMRWKVKNG